jgi:hypothetical protein
MNWVGTCQEWTKQSWEIYTHDHDIRNDIVDAGVLRETTNRNSMRSFAYRILDYDVCSIGLERYAVVAVIAV